MIRNHTSDKRKKKIRITPEVEEIEIDTSVPKIYPVTFSNKWGQKVLREIKVNEKKSVSWS